MLTPGIPSGDAGGRSKICIYSNFTVQGTASKFYDGISSNVQSGPQIQREEKAVTVVF